MKVTKLIREYVKKTVEAMPKFAKPSPVELEYEDFQLKITNFATEVEDEMRQAIQEAIENFRIVNNIGADVELKPYNYNMVCYSTFNCELCRKANTARQAREKACREAINEILVNLELGADRKELDEMLKKLAE